MKVLLVKCHRKTLFSRIEPIITEPLELEYIASLLKQEGVNHRIYDPLLEGGKFEGIFQEYHPNVLILTGYITAVDVILQQAKYAKENNPNIKVLVGGVHAEVNYQDFFVDTIDYILHADGVNVLRELLKHNFQASKPLELKGIAYQWQGKWQVNEGKPTMIDELPPPDRSYFEKYKNKTKYMNYSPVALVKTALSCPYQCNFCYCKMLNGGIYTTRELEGVLAEIEAITADYIWIVDDSFLLSRERVSAFIKGVRDRGIKKKYIVYSRVDFIANNEDLIEELATIGLIEVIVGMEAVEDHQLTDMNKNASANENVKTVEVLKKYGITLTALFIADINFTPKDFKGLGKWIKKMQLESYTVSIFTPMRGTKQYEEYQHRIEFRDNSKMDFLHLILKPEKMGKLHFYLQFYFIYIEQFFRSKYIRRFLLNNIKNLFKVGNNNG